MGGGQGTDKGDMTQPSVYPRKEETEGGQEVRGVEFIQE